MTMPAESLAPTSNLLMFTPLHATGGRGMSRTSLAIAAVCNLALIWAACRQVHQRLVVEHRAVVDLVLPAEKLPEPPRPRLTPRVVPPKTPTIPTESPAIMRHAEIMPAPPVPAPAMPHHESTPIPMATQAPHVLTALAAPAVKAVTLATTPVVVQPAGPAVATVNMPRGGSPVPLGVPGATAVNINGPRGPLGPPSVGTPGPIARIGCSDCAIGKSDRYAVPKPIKPELPRPDLVVEKKPLPVPAQPPVRTNPTVLYKPQAAYTAEATAMRIQGTVKVKVRVDANGGVTVLGVQSGLGHGLDESAAKAAQGIQFKPAVDVNGKPTAWEGIVSITFQMA